MNEPRDYGVFLCYNSDDEPEVRKVAEYLVGEGLQVWFDEWVVQQAHIPVAKIEEGIENSGSAAVFIGPSGMGPWQNAEVEIILEKSLDSGCPVIPVLLPGAPERTSLRPFLRRYRPVRFNRNPPDAKNKLYRAITGSETLSENPPVIFPKTGSVSVEDSSKPPHLPGSGGESWWQTLVSRWRQVPRKPVFLTVAFALALVIVAVFTHVLYPTTACRTRTTEFKRVDSHKLAEGVNLVRSAVIDSERDLAYFGTHTGEVVIIRLTSCDKLEKPERTIKTKKGASLQCGVLDKRTGYAYFGANFKGTPSKVIRVRFDADPLIVPVPGKVGLDELMCAGIDDNSRYAYFGTFGSAKIVKVDLSEDFRAPLTSYPVISANHQTRDLHACVIDSTKGIGYFGEHRLELSRVVKVVLSDEEDGRMKAVMKYDFEFDEKSEEPIKGVACGVIDPSFRYAYFGTRNDPGDGYGLNWVLKVNLESGNCFPYKMGDCLPACAVLNAASGFALIGTYELIPPPPAEGTHLPGRVVKISLEEGDAKPGYIDDLTLEEGEIKPCCAVLHEGYAYFGTYTEPGRIVKVAVGGAP